MQSPDKEELSLDIFEEEEGENLDDQSNSSLNPSMVKDINEDSDDAEALEQIVDTLPNESIDPLDNVPLLSAEEDELFVLDKILGHRIYAKKKNLQLYVQWKSGDCTWENLEHLKQDFPTEVAEYIVSRKLKRPFMPRWALSIVKTTRRLFKTIKIR